MSLLRSRVRAYAAAAVSDAVQDQPTELLPLAVIDLNRARWSQDKVQYVIFILTSELNTKTCRSE